MFFSSACLLHYSILNITTNQQRNKLVLSPCPYPTWIMFPDHLQLELIWRYRLGAVGGEAQRPACLLLHLCYRGTGMIGLQQRLTRLGIEGEESERSNQGRGTATGQADPFSPGDTGRTMLVGIAIAGAGYKIDPFTQPMGIVLHNNGESL